MLFGPVEEKGLYHSDTWRSWRHVSWQMFEAQTVHKSSSLKKRKLRNEKYAQYLLYNLHFTSRQWKFDNFSLQMVFPLQTRGMNYWSRAGTVNPQLASLATFNQTTHLNLQTHLTQRQWKQLPPGQGKKINRNYFTELFFFFFCCELQCSYLR